MPKMPGGDGMRRWNPSADRFWLAAGGLQVANVQEGHLASDVGQPLSDPACPRSAGAITFFGGLEGGTGF